MQRRTGVKALIILFWLVLWQAVSIAVDNSILLAGPVEAVMALIHLAATAGFWLSVLTSVLMICSGFFIGLFTGVLLAGCSYRYGIIREFIKPPVTVIKSIPVASFVILVIIWAGSGSLSLVISSLVVFPTVFLNTLAGLDSTSVKLIETGRMFRFRTRDKIRHIYLPSCAPHIESAVCLGAGMAFKSGIAAEVIGRPLRSIGTGIYLSKISLATADLFAWTFCAVVLAFLFEKLITKLMKRILKP